MGRVRGWRGAVSATAVLATGLLAVVPGAAESVAAAPDVGGHDATRPGPVPELVVPGSGEKVAAFQSLQPTGPVALPGTADTAGVALDPAAAKAAGSRLRPVDAAELARGAPVGGPRRTVDDAAVTQSFYCDEFIDENTQVGRDESGAQVLRVDYYGDVLCNFYLLEATGVAGVIDRTPGYDGRVLDVGTEFYFQYDYYGFSTGDFEIPGDIDPRARSIEVVEEVYLYSDVPWGACNPLPNLRYLLCEGLGTNLLHVIVGTSPFSTGLQDPPPLFMGVGQGAGCPVTLSAAAMNKRTIPVGEHVVDVAFEGTIACSAGITGTSEARLVDLSAPLADIRGGASGANGTSSETVTYEESEDGGRRLKAVYSGRTEAPAGRTWGGCFSDPDNYLFTRCDISGNVVNWEAEGPFPGFVGDGAVLDTGLPPNRHCQVDRADPTVVDAELTAKIIGACDEEIDAITVDLRLRGSYSDEQNNEITVTLPFGGNITGHDTDEDDDFEDGRADAVFRVDCDPQSQQVVNYRLSGTVRFQHPDLPPGSGWSSDAGWLQVENLGETLTPATCLPV